MHLQFNLEKLLREVIRQIGILMQQGTDIILHRGDGIAIAGKQSTTRFYFCSQMVNTTNIVAVSALPATYAIKGEFMSCWSIWRSSLL